MDFTVFYEPLGTSHPLRGGAGRIIVIEVILIEGRRIGGRCGGQVENCRFFLLQKWIDLDELNPMVWVPSIVRRRIDFSLAVFELVALRAVHPRLIE